MDSPTARRLAPRSAGDSGRRELLVFAAAYLTYFGVRAVTEGQVRRAFANSYDLVRVERRLGIAREGAIQGVVTGSRLLTDAANDMYMFGHWPVLLSSGILLFHFRRAQYRTLRDACLISGLIGLFVFALFPVAPPRLTDLPLVDTVTQGSPGYRQLLPHSLVNEYAAMPSFHAGWNLLAGITIYRASSHWALRTFAVLMPIAMAFSVIATANHFVLDVIAGVVIVLVSLRLAVALERRRQRPTLDVQHEGLNADTTNDICGRAAPDRPPSRERSRAPAQR